jgi:hypothetical protein
MFPLGHLLLWHGLELGLYLFFSLSFRLSVEDIPYLSDTIARLAAVPPYLPT